MSTDQGKHRKLRLTHFNHRGEGFMQLSFGNWALSIRLLLSSLNPNSSINYVLYGAILKKSQLHRVWNLSSEGYYWGSRRQIPKRLPLLGRLVTGITRLFWWSSSRYIRRIQQGREILVQPSVELTPLD